MFIITISNYGAEVRWQSIAGGERSPIWKRLVMATC